MNVHDQFARWQAALVGAKLDMGGRGDPPCGYFRRSAGGGKWEAFSVWRDERGLNCIRNIFGDGSKMTGEEIDELFCGEVYPIPYDVYVAVAENGEPWPKEHLTRLTLKEVKAGVGMTPELAERKANATIAEPGIGHNNPPEHLAPDQALAKRILNIGTQLGEWLKTIGGKASTQAEAEILAGYANKFKDFENDATAAHKAEKQPHLDAGRAVDSKWFGPVKDKAIASRSKVLAIIDAFRKEEDARRAEATRLANEAAQRAAQRGEPEATVETAATFAPEPTKIANLRGGTRPAAAPLVTDLGAFLKYCGEMKEPPPDIVDAAEKVARKWKSAGVKVPGMEGKAA